MTTAIAELVNDRRYPFVIVMTNGDRYMVEHSLQISANAEYAHWTPETGTGKFLSILQIHHLEPPNLNANPLQSDCP